MDEREEQEEQEELEKIAREKELRDIQLILNTSEGRRFFKRLFEITKYFKAGNKGDLVYREGKRSVGAEIFADVQEACPHRIPEILTLK